MELILICLFEICLVLLVGLGLFIAARLDGNYPWWVRILCLLPALGAMFALHSIFAGLYTVFSPDIVLALGTVGVYIILASRFTDKPILDRRNVQE